MSFLADDTFSNVHYKQEVFDFDLKDDFRLDNIVSNGKQFDLQRFWDSDEHEVDDDDEDDVKNYSDLTNGASSNVFTSSTKTGKQEEDFHKMLNDWQDHLSSMKTFDEEHPDSSEILSRLQNSVIDELLPERSSKPINIKKEAPCSESHESSSSHIACENNVKEENESPTKRIKRNSLCTLEAEDARSLLEQFEASEIINSNFNSCQAIEDEKKNNETNCDAQPIESAKTIKTDGGESVQLDHDYCNGVSGSEKSAVLPPQNFYHSTVADYGPTTYSRLPEYYVNLASQKSMQPNSIKDWTEKNSKKDSGLESGDVSDASEDLIPKAFKNVPMVSVLKRNCLPKVVEVKVEPKEENVNVLETAANNNSDELLPRKRKLNLEEYRSRREEREREGNIPSPRNRATSWGALSAEQRAQQKSVTETASSPKKVEVKSVEVQATPEDIISATSALSIPKSKHRKGETDSPRRRRQYRSRRVSVSSSTSTESRVSRHRSHKRRKNSRSDRRSSRSHSRGRRSWSRSRSRSRSSSVSSTCSTCSSISLSSSRNRSRKNSSSRRHGHHQPLWKTKDRFTRTLKPHERRRRHSQSSRSSNRSSRDAPKLDERDQAERMRQVEERRVIYVGRIEEGTTKADLRQRFEVFGPIIDTSVHFRDHGDNYGFVTFAYKVDAYEAVEHGNDDENLPKYDLSFGGRRAFCKQRYSDLDIERSNRSYGGVMHRSNESFDTLLREAQAKLRKRSSI